METANCFLCLEPLVLHSQPTLKTAYYFNCYHPHASSFYVTFNQMLLSEFIKPEVLLTYPELSPLYTIYGMWLRYIEAE